MIVVCAVILVIALVIGWGMTAIGLPGNWLMLLAAASYTWLVPEDSNASIGWPIVVVLGVLAVFGELIELLAGALGATKVGGSKRAAALSLLGSIIGAVFGIFVSLPIPVPIVAQLVSAVFFACLGALLGAVLGEQWKGKSLEESLQVGAVAFAGRLFGTLAKMLIGSVMAVLVVIALFVEQL